MTLNLAMTVRQKFDWLFGDTIDLSTIKDDSDLDYVKALANGIGNNNINQMWHDRRRLSIASPTDLLDLAGSLTNFRGSTVAFTQIKALLIFNKGVDSPRGTFTPTAGQDLLIGGASSNAWVALFNGSTTAKFRLRSGGCVSFVIPIDGFRVVAGTSDILQIAHDGSAASGTDITYDIVLAGIE